MLKYFHEFILGLFFLVITLPLNAQNYAVLFGCNEYQNEINLTNPIPNVKQIAQILERDYNFEYEVIENPTLSEIEETLYSYEESFKKGERNPEGQLLIFFSGHGSIENNVGFFHPVDADPDRLRSSALDYPYWGNFINDINCQHIFVAIDACFSVSFDPEWSSRNSGSSFRRVGEKGEREQLLLAHQDTKTRIFFTSDGQGKATPDRSMFAKKFQEGLLEKGGKDGILTSTELYAHVEQARPRPYCRTFGDDEANSSFLFQYKDWQEISNSDSDDQAAFLEAIDCGLPSCLENFIKTYPKSSYINAVKKQLNLSSGNESSTDDERASSKAKSKNTTTNSTKVQSAFYEENMIQVNGGNFTFGCNIGNSNCDSDEFPINSISISDFSIQRNEVTNSQFLIFLNAYQSDIVKDGKYAGQKMIYPSASGLTKRDGSWSFKEGYQNHPVVAVTWYGAVTFANYYGLRLPTEAEWEFVAKGGKNNQKYIFSGGDNLYNIGVYEGNSDFDSANVGSKGNTNILGVNDMSGNVWEWCQDWYGPAYNSTASDNPKGPGKGSAKVIRGGSYSQGEWEARVTNRDYKKPTTHNNTIGFRCAK